MVQVQFKVGQPPEDSLVKLYNRVIANRGRLPADAGIPLIQAVDADDVPIVTVTLASPTYDDYGLKRLADSVAERLRSTPGVSVVSVYGGRNREIDVAFDPVRLQAFSISLAEARRSEEHTSELQSLMRISYAVFCLKKKKRHH